MREIKFRGYAVEEMVESQWLYGFGAKDIDYVDGTVEWHLHTLNGVYEVEPESIGQFTGLKDRNGREIYEGDIVKHATDEGVYKVIFEEGGFYVKNLFEYDFQTINEYPLEVIGNIYENPELLEAIRND